MSSSRPPSLGLPPLFARLRDARSVLISGAGGGFDVYAGLPLAIALWDLGKDVHLAGLSFALSIPSGGREAAPYLDAVEHARAALPEWPSIVQGSVAAALRGGFGDVRFTERTAGGELFINPLMSVYFAVDLGGLARHCLYLDRLEGTRTMRQVAAVIEEFRAEVDRPRPARPYPH